MEPYEGLEMEIILFKDVDIIASSREGDADLPWMEDSLQIPGIPDPNQIYKPDSF